MLLPALFLDLLILFIGGSVPFIRPTAEHDSILAQALLTTMAVRSTEPIAKRAVGIALRSAGKLPNI